MVTNKLGRDIPQPYADQYGVFEGELANIKQYDESSRRIKPVKPGDSKLLGSIREAIEKTGLTDGMTISFHHHFREGDFIMNMVLEEIAKMGIKNLSIAPSSIANVHEPLIDHIKNGVVTNITSSGLRDKVGAAISEGLMENPVVIRSHGGRARAIASGDIHIDVAFLGAPSSDAYGNVNGTKGKATCGSLGYAMIDAKYADQVVILTDNLVPYPNTPISIPQTDVDYVVTVDAIGDPQGIAKGATRFTKNPKELLIAEYAAKVITNSPYFKEGFSFQTGTGGASLAVTRFMREAMIKENIKASFALGGITNAMVELLEEGLVEKILDVQDFDHPSAVSLGKHAEHYEIDANMYASPLSKGAVINQLDTCILSALEVDTNFNVNVMTGSDGVIRGASGGHCDTAFAAKMSLVISPLIRGRIPTFVDEVNTVITPGTSVDVVVTEVGIAINPNRQDLADHFKSLNVPQFSIEELKEKAYAIVGTPERIQYGDKVVALIEYRDGSLMDVVYNV
ncbi:TPA: citrate lyase subunit alpha [Streptococcus pyogenes]|uniref:citrate lyase subunit alpha n=1 Tax=Streptococcus pyogenes TaxID=1314 RepID=UPI000459296B|nr:citrate lyase subunit alpha [Streptococcus pyogenes]HER4537031.1 citrate lyase subunit alpha [Streptococcus pyogenes NGAS673]HER4549072.1 citrate lyase subunit alpha [Streptococcus pyogenes NGAS660]HER4557813.1 citrate lyase subunit alpha [Streptococcus pyogenes NGAS672]HER4559195.1 citrate lyase subunit alpha [Streptococcus pyogenes NGAS663]HER4626739.1 citrate lyase subunit alpha [Streptococcus pyogenes NGAS549]HER4630546.1 citrate lyase subunit alpha [Streptococcus pyogenes NGAS595]HER